MNIPMLDRQLHTPDSVLNMCQRIMCMYVRSPDELASANLNLRIFWDKNEFDRNRTMPDDEYYNTIISVFSESNIKSFGMVIVNGVPLGR